MATIPGSAEWSRTGLPALQILSTSTGTGVIAASRKNFGSAYSNWAVRGKISGGTTELTFQLVGAVATSSDADTVLVAMTTWTLSANSCDATIWITGKPVTAVAVNVTTAGASSGASLSVWVTGTP